MPFQFLNWSGNAEVNANIHPRTSAHRRRAANMSEESTASNASDDCDCDVGGFFFYQIGRVEVAFKKKDRMRCRV